MNKKYELLKDQTLIVNVSGKEVTLYRIHVIDPNFKGKKTLDPETNLGGWIEKEENLSQEGTCMVYDEAKVFGDAVVNGNGSVMDSAMVYGSARIFENAEIRWNALVKGNAHIRGNAIIEDHAYIDQHVDICENVNVYGRATLTGGYTISGQVRIGDDAALRGNGCIKDTVSIHDNAVLDGYVAISGHVEIRGDSKLLGDVRLEGAITIFENAQVMYTSLNGGHMRIGRDAHVSNMQDIVEIGPIGSRNDYTTFYKTVNRGIGVCCGCFNGSLDEFTEKVRTTHVDNPQVYDSYMKAINLAMCTILQEIRSKKYVLTDEVCYYQPTVNLPIQLYRIRVVSDIYDHETGELIIKKGTLGGWIESEDNLSQEGCCMVYDNAKVCGDAIVSGDAEICDEATVYGENEGGNTPILTIEGSAIVYGHAKIRDNAYVGDYAKITDTSIVANFAIIKGHAVVEGNARVRGSSKITDHATISDDAKVLGTAHVNENAKIFGYAQLRDGNVSGYARIYDHAMICSGASKIYEQANIGGKVIIRGNSIICGNARLSGNERINDDAYIELDRRDILTIGPIGSRDDYVTFYHTTDDDIKVVCGCFNDTIDAFEKRVIEVYHGTADANHEEDYLAAIQIAKSRIGEGYYDKKI